MRHRISIRGSVRPSFRYASSNSTQMTHLVARSGLLKRVIIITCVRFRENFAWRVFVQHLSIIDPPKLFLRFEGKELVNEFHVFDIAIFVFLNPEQLYQLIRLFCLHLLG